MARYPLLDFELFVGTWSTADLALPDTGFEGGVVIPAGVGHELLAEPDIRPFQFADGHVLLAPAWSGVLDLNGHRFSVEVAAVGPRYLIGREVLDEMEICFQFGREVRLRFQDDA